MKTLNTQRLILKSFEEEYLDDFFEYASSPYVGPAAGWEPHKTIEDSKVIMKSFLESDENYMIIYKENGKLIGSVGLHADKVRAYPNSREIGYVLSHDYWGMGIMTEAVSEVIECAFEHMGLSVLTVAHFPDNRRSKRVIEKLGFVYEGLVPEAYLCADGTYRDEQRYRMTAEDYKRMRRNTVW